MSGRAVYDRNARHEPLIAEPEEFETIEEQEEIAEGDHAQPET